ncbi:hypothetical protein AB0K02_27685 [Streptomyces sp. NPDC049597]|uniref:hypothetical protein n=1 Tax=Streptomyces sp. NPDC049597 TaxID=3155276 RepID=UPI00343FC997
MPIPDFSGLEGGDEQQAAGIVRDVALWYNTQLAAESRAPVPDKDRIEELSRPGRPRWPTKHSWRPPTQRRQTRSPPSMPPD